MITSLNKIIFDFSPYFEKEIKFEEYYSLKDSISSIIKNTNHLNEEMKKRLIIIPPQYTINGRPIFENLSFEDNGIENGDIISVSKHKKKRKLRSIRNKNQSKNEPISKEYFITTGNRNTVALFKKEENLEVIKKENEKIIIAPKGKCKSAIISISVIVLLIIAIILSLVLYFKFRRKDKPKNYYEEKLISKLDYKSNQIYNLLDINKLTYIYEPKNNSKIPKENKNFNLTEYIHYTFGIEKEKYDTDNITKTQKKFYHGFLAINNITIENETDIIINLYLNEINQNKNKRFLKNLDKFRYLNEKQIHLNINDKDDLTQPIISFDFYKNGVIKQIYFPNNLADDLINYLYNTLNKFIPKLNESLYCKNITEELNKISLNNSKEELNDILNDFQLERNNNTDFNLEEINENLNNIRRLNEYNMKYYTKYRIIIAQSNYMRNLESNINDTNNNFLEEIEYIDKSFEENEINFMEYYNFTSVDNNNIPKSYTEINQYREGLAGEDEVKFENSTKIILTNIEINDDLGIIKSINCNTSIKLNNNINENKYDENQQKKYNINNEFNEYNLNISNDNINLPESPINSIIHYSNNSLINKDNDIIIDEILIHKMKNIFDKYNYKLKNETIFGNKTLRILNSISKFGFTTCGLDNKIIVENISYYNYENEQKKRKLNIVNNNYKNTYYGLKDINILRNIYNRNILGFQFKGESEYSIIQSNGKTLSNCNIYFGPFKLTFNIGYIETNMHIITKNLNEMAKSFVEILKNINKELILRNQNYSHIIINIEKNISELIDKKNLYDFSNEFKNPLNKLFNEVKNFSSNLFDNLLILIDNAHSNYSLILNDIKLDKLEQFKMIREITKYEYINFINSVINSLDEFSKNVLIYINKLEILIQNITDIKLDLLYDIIDNIEESKKIFKNFISLLFNSVIKGVKIFKYNLDNHIEEILDELSYITEFISSGLKNNEILKTILDEETKNRTIYKLKDFKNIIHIITSILTEQILNDYEKELINKELQNIRFTSEKKKEDLLSKIESNSNILIRNIKNKIELIEKYELYSSNIDKINEINDEVEHIYSESFVNKIIKNISNIESDIFEESSEIIKSKKILFNISKNIKNEINNEINEMNKYFENYVNKYKEQNIYNLNMNLYYIIKFFSDESMNNLIQNYLYLIRDTINIHLRNIIYNNYNLEEEYANEVINKVEELRFYLFLLITKRIAITTGVKKKMDQFITKNVNIISLILGDDLREIIINSFNLLKEEILSFINKRLLSINQYYLNEGDYSYYFNFISKGINEIKNKIDNINNYFNDENFEMGVEPYYLDKLSELSKFESKMENYFTIIYKQVLSVAFGTSDENSSYDCCVQQWWVFFFFDIACFKVEHNNVINQINDNLDSTKEYVLNYRKKIYNNFINEFSKHLDNYVEISQKLYNNLYMYIEKKINDNGNINILLNEYNKIIYDLIDNNNYIFKFNKNKNKFFHLNIDIPLEKVNKGLEKINNDFYELYYLNNKTDYLQFPYEIIIKCMQIINELNHTLNFTKTVINSIYEEKIKNIMKEIYNFINDINNNNFKYIILHSNFSSIFMIYSLKKKSFISKFFKEHDDNLHDLISKVNNIFENHTDILNYYHYDLKFKNIINNFNIFINEFNQTIYDNFTKVFCENKTDFSNENEINSELIDNKTNLISENCYVVFFDSELNYSKYNFQITKIRNSIIYTKNVYENNRYVNDLYNDENIISRIINPSHIIKKDEILNNKNIWSIYNDNLNSLNKLNNESKIILKDSYDILSEDFLNSNYSINNEKNKKLFIESMQILNRTLRNNYEPFNNKFKVDLDKMSLVIDNQLNNFNHSIIKIFNEINKRYIKEYNYYSLNISNINISIASYINSINDILENYKKQINNDYLIHNSYLNSMKKLFKLQIENYRKTVETFSNNFNFELLNITLDLGKFISEILNKDYDSLEFSFIYDYVKIFEENEEIYKKRINAIFINLKNRILNFVQENYDILLFNLTNQKNYLSNIFMKQLRENYTYCYNYSKINLKEIILKDEINWERYEKYSEDLKYCLNETNFNSSFCETLEEIYYVNETENWLICNKNNFFKISNIIIEDIDNINRNEINYFSSNISYILNEFLFDGIYLENFFSHEFSLNVTKNNNISLIDLNNFYTDFENFQFKSEYLSNVINNKYINNLKEIIIKNFNESYFHFAKDYLINEINISLFSDIIDKINMDINYISKKIIEENKYYIYLLSNTKEIGFTTKECLLNLYSYLFNKFNDTISIFLEQLFNEKLFYFMKEKKYLFSDYYLNYLINSKNNENCHLKEIFKFDEYLNDLIDNREFNKSLQNISEMLLKDEIIKKLKEDIIKIIYQKINNLNNLFFSLTREMNETLNQIIILNYDEDLLPVVKENNNFIKIVNNQTNRFTFEVSDNPLIIFDNFTSSYLIPPLNIIKEHYNQIEMKLLRKIINIIDNFDDIYEFIKSKLEKEYKIKNIQKYFNETNNLLENYFNILIKDFYDIKDKLFEYTYKNGLNRKNHRKRNLIPNIKEKIYSNNNNHKINNNRKKKFKERIYFSHKDNNKERILDSNSENAPYNFYHIEKEFKYINKTINSFGKDILSSDFKKIYNNLNIFILKVQNYLIQLERSIDLSVLKFSSILTKETINRFKEKIYCQYNLINSFIFDYIEDITYNIINYINLVNLKTNNTFISQNLTETMISIYDELSNTINNKFDVLNYENLERRRLEWIDLKNFGKEFLDDIGTWNLPFSFSINLFDFLKHCGIDFGSKNKAYAVKTGSNFKVNFKFDFEIIFGFEFGLNFYFSEEKKTQVYIELYIEVGVSVSAEFGYFRDFSKLGFLESINNLLKLNLNLTDVKEDLNLCSKFRKKETNSNGNGNGNGNNQKDPEINFLSISFAIGVSINIASVRVGLKFEYSFSQNEKSNQLVIYYEFKFLCIKLYIYFEFKFLDIFSNKFEFSADLLCVYEKDGNHTLYNDTTNLTAQNHI